MATARPTQINRKKVASYLKPRPQDAHKGMFGMVTVIGGDTGMIGAALLAGRAALKLGAGSVRIGLLAKNAPALDMQMAELMVDKASAVLKSAKTDILVVGCGMGTSLAAHKLLYNALRLDVATVLDADALNILSLRPDLRSMLVSRKAPVIVTPHPGEAARLLASSIEDIQANRSNAASSLSKRFHCNAVLKGKDSICATSDGKLHINKTGNPSMSSAGMGDVLSGIIAAFLAQGLSADQALLLGVHLHGAAGDALAEQHASIGMSATEVTEWARWLLNQWVSK